MRHNLEIQTVRGSHALGAVQAVLLRNTVARCVFEPLDPEGILVVYGGEVFEQLGGSQRVRCPEHTDVTIETVNRRSVVALHGVGARVWYQIHLKLSDTHVQCSIEENAEMQSMRENLREQGLVVHHHGEIRLAHTKRERTGVHCTPQRKTLEANIPRPQPLPPPYAGSLPWNMSMP